MPSLVRTRCPGIVNWFAILVIALVLVTGSCSRGHNDGVLIPILPPGNINDQPAWSHDGATIAFRHIPQVPADTLMPFGLYLISPSGAAPRLLVRGAYLQPTWSPDDQRLACRNPSGQLCLIDAQSANVTIVGFAGGTSPTWSPDGQLLAFDSPAGDPNESRSVWIAAIDGTGAHDIGKHGAGEWRDPDWSIDGRTLVYQRYYAGSGAPEIATVDTSGRELRRLTVDESLDLDPQWSRDGQWIAWTRNVNGDVAVWVMRADGGGRRRLSGGQQPAWSPDGQKLVFVRSRAEGGSDLYITSVTGGSALMLAARGQSIR
jgi:Tol biopolymer transport system component